MKKLVLVALSAMAFGACGGGDDKKDISVGSDADVTTQPDATPVAVCNPLTQAGCDDGEKCAQLVESESPALSRTACVPAGDVTDGEVCTRGAAGAETGFDNCAPGLDCLSGSCTPICETGPPDTCREEGQSALEGDFCTLYENLFEGNTGVCVPACDPLADGACGEGGGCFINLGRGIAACAGVPPGAEGKTQNSPCYGPATGGCYLNGCEDGFTPMLPSAPGETSQVCARHCSPANTHLGATALASGNNDTCGVGPLTAKGGTAGNVEPHQCRFLQSFYSDTESVSVELGMCVPTEVTGGSWADCTALDWEGMKTVWNDALPNGEEAANTAWNGFCLDNPDAPSDPETSILPKCIGLFRGCLNNEESNAGMPPAGDTTFRSRRAWAESLGIKIPVLGDAELY